MPTFDTPEPISVSLDVGVGDIRIEATDRTDTIVEVRPSDPAKTSDVAAADQTRVDHAGGRLTVRAPKGWRQWTPWGGHGSIDVRIGLPVGSTVRVEAGVAAVRCTGRIGEYRSRTGVGDVELEEAGPVEIKTGAGDVTVERATGRAQIVTGSGAIRIRSVEGIAVVKNSNGDTWLGEVAGEARVSAANGTISIDVAREGAVVKTANGDVRLGEVARGAIVAQSAFGTVEVGVRDGVAVWLDLHTRFGHVQNDLETAGSPGAGEEVVEVHGSTSYGDIVVRRSSTSGVREAS
jgi:Putative adhesin